MEMEGYKRKLTTILSADVAGYSRLMGEDEAGTVKTLTTYRGIMADLIKQHRGRVVDSPGDNLLAEFTSVVDAVQCAVSVQKEFEARNAELPENRRMEFRIGINLGDVIEEEDRIYGDGVNIAARLEALADPGGICVSKTTFDHIETKLPLGYEYLGEQDVKNIAKPVGAYRVLMEPRVLVASAEEKVYQAPKWRQKKIIGGAIAILIAILCAIIWAVFFQPTSKRVTSVNTAALKVEVTDQNWDIIPAGTPITYEGRQALIKQDLVHANFKLRVTNTSSRKLLIPDWILLDRSKDYLDPFRLTGDDGKKYIKEKLFINGNITKVIYLRCTSKSLNELRVKEPLFLADITHTFIFQIEKIPDRGTLLKKRQDKINN